MIKRPLNTRFTEAVRLGRKTTTIRDKAWPVGKPIMLYNWSGAAYRSPHVDVAPVIVRATSRIVIARSELRPDVVALLPVSPIHDGPLWQVEGFDSLEEMRAWFRRLLKPGQSVTKHLMRFALWDEGEACDSGPRSANPAPKKH